MYLHQQKPMAFITIKTASYPTELYTCKSLLESEGIQCFIRNENTLQMAPFYSNALGGVQLQVDEEDALHAIEILKEAGQLNEQEFEPSDFWKNTNLLTRDLPFMKKLPVELRLIIILGLVCLVIGVLVFVTMD